MLLCSRCEKTRLYARFKLGGLCAKCVKLGAVPPKTAAPTCPVCLEPAATQGTCIACSARGESIKAQRPELVVTAFLEKARLQADWPAIVHNRADPLTKTTCCRRRVDIRMDFVYFQVIVEVDEHQHKGYGETCELKRLLEVVNSSGGIPTIIFRFNPDNFRRCGVPATAAPAARLALLRERIERRVGVLSRRIRNDRSRTKSIVLPILYIEYLFFDTVGTDDVAIRSYLHDTDIARAILKCV